MARTPVQSEAAAQPPSFVVVVPTGQAVHAGVGLAALPPQDTVPIGQKRQLVGAVAELP